ncbi:MAG: DNA repair protein RadA [Candidatus Curtissbacteria bacterium]|nr:DNA repair protein RadA [Candidatus Curtissbacteria bacterium]
MPKVSSNFVCSQCGYDSLQWFGKCPGCGEWNTLVEFRESKASKNKSSVNRNVPVTPVKLSEIKSFSVQRFSSQIGELDRVLGGGFVPGSVILLAGDPGIGKSTLLLQAAASIGVGWVMGSESSPKTHNSFPSPVYYISGEESPEQIKVRAERLGLKNPSILFLNETDVDEIIRVVGANVVGYVESLTTQNSPSLLIIDSIQTLYSSDFEGTPGSVSQVKGCSQKLIELAKKKGITTILVGHVTKEGEVAGPMMLSHMVDVVLFMEGERFADLRMLRGLKNRFGPTDEVGVFRMTNDGMEAVENPSEIFLTNSGGTDGQIGSVIVCAMEGTRPILLEIQALVTQSALAIPRRVVSGIDYNRVVLLSAVLQKTAGLSLYNQDIFVKVAGGFKIAEPAADLAVCLAIASSYSNKPVPSKVCVFGEVGLLGEIRTVSNEAKRTKEAKRLGFSKVLNSGEVGNIREAIKILKVEDRE